MSNDDNAAASGDASLTRIDVDEPAQLQSWAKKLNVTAEQIKEAVAAVGDAASDVEEHLKGSRSTTNAELTRQAGAGNDKPA